MLLIVGLVFSAGLLFILITLLRRLDDRPLLTFPFGADALSFDGSGKLLLAVHDGMIDLQDVKERRQVELIKDERDGITTLALDANRELAYCGTAKGHLRPLDLKTFQLSDGISMGSSRTLALAISPKAHMIAAAFSGDPAWKVVLLIFRQDV